MDQRRSAADACQRTVTELPLRRVKVASYHLFERAFLVHLMAQILACHSQNW